MMTTNRLNRFTRLQTPVFLGLLSLITCLSVQAQLPERNQPGDSPHLPSPPVLNERELSTAENFETQSPEGAAHNQEGPRINPFPFYTMGEADTREAPPIQWTLLADGWIDREGFNLKRIDRTSTLRFACDASGKAYQLQKGDIISHINGHKILNQRDYARLINGARNPNAIQLTVVNGSDHTVLNLTVAARRLHTP